MALLVSLLVFAVDFGVTLGSLWGHFGVILGSVWGHFGVTLVALGGGFGVTVGTLGLLLGDFDHVRITFESHWPVFEKQSFF